MFAVVWCHEVTALLVGPGCVYRCVVVGGRRVEEGTLRGTNMLAVYDAQAQVRVRGFTCLVGGGACVADTLFPLCQSANFARCSRAPRALHTPRHAVDLGFPNNFA